MNLLLWNGGWPLFTSPNTLFKELEERRDGLLEIYDYLNKDDNDTTTQVTVIRCGTCLQPHRSCRAPNCGAGRETRSDLRPGTGPRTRDALTAGLSSLLPLLLLKTIIVTFFNSVKREYFCLHTPRLTSNHLLFCSLADVTEMQSEQ